MIIITGGKGFVGYYLYKIASKYEKVVVLDNLINPSFISSNIDFINIDLSKDIPDIKDVEIIYHLAADISVLNSLKNPKFNYSNNILSTLNILELARKTDSKIIFSSSAAVYANSNEPIKEDYLKSPLSIYGLSKLHSEHLIEYYNKLYGIDYCILRYSNVYGYGATMGVIPIFISKMLKNEDVEIYGDPIRDFINVKDVALFTYVAKFYSGIFNVSTGKGTRVYEIFEMLAEMLKYNKKPIIKDWREGEIKISILNNSKLLSNFKKVYDYGWNGFINIKEGLEDIIKNIK